MPYTELEKNRAKVEDFPAIDAAAFEKKINALYPSFVFYRKGKKEIEIHTSCCWKKVTEPWIKKTMTPADHELRQAKHNETGTCPFCGTKVTYKEIGRIGKAKRLKQYIPVVILSARDGDLYVRAYWTLKHYQEKLEAKPVVYSPSVYCFSARDHSAREYCDPEDACYVREQSGKYRVKNSAITEPFTDGGWCMTQYVPYTVLNPGEILQSDLRWCQYDRWKEEYDVPRENGTDLYFMRYLTMAAIYPDKVEMLIKSGLGKIVDDFVCQRRKHALWFDWDAGSLKDTFKGMTRQQLREISESGMPLDEVDLWAKNRKSGVTLTEVHQLCRKSWRAKEALREAGKRKISVKKLLRYLEKQADRTKESLPKTAVYWLDYLEMAEELGWKLDVETVLMPPRLRERHDEAVQEKEARRRRSEIEQEMKRLGKLDELLVKNEEKMKKRRRKYNVEGGGYFIRIAENGEEIILEGATLGHCVGGYAERHLNGQTTILFLRRSETPEASLYTIEMDGDKLRQIHGYKNDAGLTGKDLPGKKMAWMLEPWLAWLKDGSPRDKKGRAKISFEQKETEEVKSA